METTPRNGVAVSTEDVKVWFPVRRGLGGTLAAGLFVRAVDGVSLRIRAGEMFGLAGESGCGKTTLGRAMVRLLDPTAGKILFKDADITTVEKEPLRQFRRRMQMIFQDPYESLNPRFTVYDTLAEPLRVHGLVRNQDEERARIEKVLDEVELTPVSDFILRFPHQLSGGQRQRVAVARALILNPEFIVADEPVSMLDVSIRAEILNLLLEMKARYNLSLLFITHDLSLVRHMCDRIGIMYLGKIVELGSVDDVLLHPLHPYTTALIRAVPDPDPDAERSKVVIAGEVPSPIHPPAGCRFHPRCPIAIERCRVEEPLLLEHRPGHFAACHRAGEYQP